MPIISVRDNEIDERERGKKCRLSVRAKWFCSAFKLGFVQLMCKAFLIFKLNLELALSIREIYK